MEVGVILQYMVSASVSYWVKPGNEASLNLRTWSPLRLDPASKIVWADGYCMYPPLYNGHWVGKRFQCKNLLIVCCGRNVCVHIHLHLHVIWPLLS